MSNEDHRKYITRLGVSAHRLVIEWGRYSVPSIPADKRFCKLCNNGETKYEFHSMSCSHYSQLHNTLIINIQSECRNFDQLNKQEQFVIPRYKHVIVLLAMMQNLQTMPLNIQTMPLNREKIVRPPLHNHELNKYA